MGPEFLILGAIISLVGSFATASAQEDAGERQRDLLLQNAAQQRELGEQERLDVLRQGSAAKATQRAQIGAGGVGPEGTPVVLRSNLEKEIRFQALKSLTSRQAQAVKSENEANTALASGRSAAAASRLGGLGSAATLLSGIDAGDFFGAAPVSNKAFAGSSSSF